MLQDIKTVGTLVRATFPEFGIEPVRARIDTGAYTGALHCTKIAEKDTPTGKVLQFAPFDHPETLITKDEFVVRYVKSSNGVSQKRYFIETMITIEGNTYPISLSLADRRDMKWPVLIGRRFLRKYNFLVDVNKPSA